MRIRYEVEEHYSAEGEIELDLAAEEAWENARSHADRHASVIGSILEAVEDDDAVVYSRRVDFAVVPDDEEGPEPPVRRGGGA